MRFLTRTIIALLTVTGIVTTCIFIASPTAHAASGSDFSIQVSPSPLVATLMPGQQTELELKVFNSSTSPVDLKISAHNFSLNDTTGEVKVDDAAPATIADWVRFSAGEFTVQPGQWYTQKVTISLPADAGFSYHFAIVIAQRNIPLASESNRIIRGSVAVFTLLNVDRPGATRKLETVELESDKRIYEYLPATIRVKFHNTGNTIVQPYGNIFIQRSSDDATPIATLPVNENKGYILPGSSRTLSTTWSSGFPKFVTGGDKTTHEEWDWSHINDFRFGQYTTKLVGVYNDGHRDVPLEAEISFWVLPWKLLIVLLVVLVLVVVGIWSIVRNILRKLHHKKQRHFGLRQ